MRKYGMRKLSVGFVSVVLGVLLLPNIVVQGGNNRYISSSIYASDEMHVKKDKFKPSQELLDYLRKPIPYDKPTQAPDGVLSVNETQEYVIKAIMEQQPAVIFYGPDGFDKKVLEEVLYTPSYGSLIKHIYGEWKTDKEEVNFEKGIYRYITRFNYATLKEDVMRAEKYLDEVAKWLEKKLDEEYKTKFKNTPDSEDFKKALIIHDFIVKNVAPNFNVQPNNPTLVKPKLNDKIGKEYESHTLPAAIFGENTVCQGYAMLFDRLAYKMGLESKILRGTSMFKYWKRGDKSQEAKNIKDIDYFKTQVNTVNYKNFSWANHMWNQVKIDGRWYHVDVTHDAVSSRQNPKYRYDRFLVSDSSLEKQIVKPSGIIDSKTRKYEYIDYIDIAIWNKNEVDLVPEDYKMEKLYYQYNNERELHSDNKPFFSPVKSESKIKNDILSFDDIAYIKNNVKPISQITYAHKKNETVNVLTGTTLKDLPKKLGATIIKSTNSNKILELGSAEKIDVLAKSTNNNYDELSNISGKEVEIELYNDNVEVKSKKVKVRFLSKDKMPKPETFIFTMNGYDNISIDQYHHYNDNLASDYNKKQKEEKKQELTKKIFSKVSASHRDLNKYKGNIKLEILDLEKVRFDNPGEYKVNVVATGNDNLRVKKELTITVKKAPEKNRLTISTKNNQEAYQINSTDVKKEGYNKFIDVIKKYIDPTIIFDVFGQTQKLDGYKMYLVDKNNVKWLYNEQKDNFEHPNNANYMFTEKYSISNMKDMLDSNLSLKLIIEREYQGYLQTTPMISLNVIKDDDKLINHNNNKEEIIKNANTSNFSISESVKYINAINETDSHTHLKKLQEKLEYEQTQISKNTQKKQVKYKVIHKNNNKILFE
ncbi:transglutaminase domain-containing protein, partial [Helcococcus ovis]